MATESGLRERKKRETRQLIFETASRLFSERGFDAVTVAEIAREANVSEVTVFNYFSTKEELFFGGMEFFEERLLQAVRERDPGESALAAFRRLILESTARLEIEENAQLIHRAASLIGASPALQVREREIVARYTERLATLLAEETGVGSDEVEPLAAAGALMVTHRALVAYVRKQILAGKHGRELAMDTRSQAVSAYARLESGLSNYAVKKP